MLCVCLYLPFYFPENLLTSEGRELRRSLFSLKQIFQDDKDLVHGFVALGGLNSLVRVGSGADQNYQNYILRALGQVKVLIGEYVYCVPEAAGAVTSCHATKHKQMGRPDSWLRDASSVSMSA